MDKSKKLVCGVGINDAGYVVQKEELIGHANGKRKRKLVWRCPYFQVWKGMLERCYYEKLQQQRPSYIGCSVSEDWLTFSNFKTWMEKQGWEGRHLDKDLLFEGNKIYSAETCVFVTPQTNAFIKDNSAARGELLIGTCWHKQAEKFMAYCRNPFTKRKEHLGYFTTEIQAHEAWRKRKLELAHELAAIQTDPRVAKALIERYSNPKQYTEKY